MPVQYETQSVLLLPQQYCVHTLLSLPWHQLRHRDALLLLQ